MEESDGVQISLAGIRLLTRDFQRYCCYGRLCISLINRVEQLVLVKSLPPKVPSNTRAKCILRCPGPFFAFILRIYIPEVHSQPLIDFLPSDYLLSRSTFLLYRVGAKDLRPFSCSQAEILLLIFYCGATILM